MLELGHSNRWFFRFLRPSEWFVRAWGFGIAVRDHRDRKPNFTERNKMKGRYLHLGPYCFSYLGREARMIVKEGP